MSWYTDPKLFIFEFTRLYRVTKEFGINPVNRSDLTENQPISFSEHLSLVNNKETDFAEFKASFRNSVNSKFINCKGLVINWDHSTYTGIWSREELNSPFWRLPGITYNQESVTALWDEKQALVEENSELKVKINSIKVEKEAIIDKRVLDLEAEIFILKDQVNRERDEKNALISGLGKQVQNLTSKLVHCCGASGGGSSVEEPWITDQTDPGNWVCFEELDVLGFSKDIPLKITKATGGLKLGNDNTTNVQVKRFYQGMVPIVVVDIAELTPNREDARFDPYVWGSYNNAGIIYAARKPFASEM